MVTVLELAVWTFVLGASGLALGIVVYAVVSFMLMSPYTTARTFGVAVRELVREALLAALTQPLLPLYYVVGRRMEPLFMRRGVCGSGTPIVFVHGYMQNRVGFLGLARSFARKGMGPLYGINYPWFASIESNVKRLERFVSRVCEETNSPAVDLVCHSMGGLIAMEMIHREVRQEDIKVRRCVTIATPHAGVAWRGPLIGVGATNLRRGSKVFETHAGWMLKLPTLSVFSTHDNIVHPKETSHLVKRGGRDIEVDGYAHLAILFSPQVAEHVASFLLEPGPAVARVEPARPAELATGSSLGESAFAEDTSAKAAQ